MADHQLFAIRDQVAVVTGGGGVLGGAMAQALAQAGARVAVLSQRAESCGRVAAAISAAGGQAIALACDVLDRSALEQSAAEVATRLGPVDILVNAVGGNQPAATVSADRSFFALDSVALREIFALNFDATLACCQVFGQTMAERQRGCIINIVSMAALRPLSRVVAYGAAKAALVNFTQWLAVHLAQTYSPQIRVNALAPGFFLTEQNRFLLSDPATGAPTERARRIIEHTPLGRLGTPDDLAGALLWLASPAAAFVTGIVVPVDGGFAAFSGV